MICPGGEGPHAGYAGHRTQPAATATPAIGRPPFRANHVGSLLRPPGLLQARDDAAAGRISGEDLRAAEDTAIREVVRRQQEVGLASATDGELRRESWHMDFIYQLGGIKKVQDDTIRVAFHNKQKDYEWAPPSAHVVAPLTLEHTIFGDAFAFLADTVKPRCPSSRSRRSAWCITAAAARPSTSRSIPTSASSGPIWRRRTPRRCSGCTSSAAATCSSTTPAWLT